MDIMQIYLDNLNATIKSNASVDRDFIVAYGRGYNDEVTQLLGVDMRSVMSPHNDTCRILWNMTEHGTTHQAYALPDGNVLIKRSDNWASYDNFMIKSYDNYEAYRAWVLSSNHNHTA